MLEDSRRNGAFARAVRRALARRPAETVVEIGAGAGLLALVAARAAPAATVYAVEENREMADVLDATLSANGSPANARVVRARSTAWSVPGDGARADVVIAEVFDAGLLGEGCLPTLRDAARRILRRGGEMIPRSAALYCVLLDATPKAAAGIEARALDAVPRFALARATVPLSVDLRAASGARRLSPPSRLFSFDFTDGDAPLERVAAASTTFAAAGTLNAYALYFVLDLDGDASLSTSPDDPPTCWFQSLRYLPAPLDVRPGATVTLRAAHTADSVAVAVENLRPPPYRPRASAAGVVAG